MSTKTIVNIQEELKVMSSRINLNKRIIITVWKREEERGKSERQKESEPWSE